MHIRSAALRFAFSMLVTCQAAYGSGHDIEVYTINTDTAIHYRHKGPGVKGNVFIRKTDTYVQWSCDQTTLCQTLQISFPGSNPCTTLSPGPAKAITCTLNKTPPASIMYKTTVYNAQNVAQPLTDDPEFIVDDNGQTGLIMIWEALFIAVGSAVGSAVGYRVGKARAR